MNVSNQRTFAIAFAAVEGAKVPNEPAAPTDLVGQRSWVFLQPMELGLTHGLLSRAWKDYQVKYILKDGILYPIELLSTKAYKVFWSRDDGGVSPRPRKDSILRLSISDQLWR